MVQTIFDHNCRTKNNEILPMKHFQEKVLLVVNTASKCGFTPQLKGLEKLYKNLNSRGLEILGFPCNQFGRQDPGSIENISQFCELNYGVTFTIFNKIEVNGTDADPLFESLKTSAPGIFGTTAIKWNFTKFLIDQTGSNVQRFAPITTPQSIEKHILALLED